MHQPGCRQPPADTEDANQAPHPILLLPLIAKRKKKPNPNQAAPGGEGLSKPADITPRGLLVRGDQPFPDGKEPLLPPASRWWAGAHLQLLGGGGGHGDQLLQMPWLPQCIDLLVPLQDRFFPEVDPDDAGMLPLGVRQVSQDTPQGLGEGVGKGDGRARSPFTGHLAWRPSPWWPSPHLGAGLRRPVDGHLGHPSEVGHAHLLGGAQHVRAEALIRHLQQGKAWARGVPLPPTGFPAHLNLSPVVPTQEKTPNLSNPSKMGLKAARLHFKGGRWLFLRQCHTAASHQQLWPPSPLPQPPRSTKKR